MAAINKQSFRVVPRQTRKLIRHQCEPKTESAIPSFKVDDVQVSKENLETIDASVEMSRIVDNFYAGVTNEMDKRILSAFGKLNTEKHEIESSSFPHDGNLVEASSLMSVALLAFAKHYPLGLKPDDLWTAILCGFAQHVDFHHEELRTKFVQFDGKKKLLVIIDHFVKGHMTSEDWETVFPAFTDQIEENVPADLFSATANGFSTTTNLEMACHQISLMASMKNYFSYGMTTCCGIPYIQLYGTVSDWKALKSKTETLAKFMMPEFAEKWMAGLLPVLDQFISAAEGNVDTAFWKLICKRLKAEMMSGSTPSINGWINVFYPYLASARKNKYNEYLNNWTTEKRGPDPSEFPRSITSAPVEWKYYNEKFDMHFHSGLIGAVQDPKSKMLRPQHGWIISYD